MTETPTPADTDIVERLKTCDPAACHDAIAEIKALRDERDAAHKAAIRAYYVKNEAQADVAALREELERCVDAMNPEGTGCDIVVDRRMIAATTHARAALSTDHPGQPLLDRLERYEKAVKVIAYGETGCAQGQAATALNDFSKYDKARAALKEG